MTTEAPSLPEVPGPIGPWRLVARLGSGAHGTAWRAVDEHGRTCVVKLLAEPPGAEIRALSRVHHPSVVGLLGAGSTPLPHLVMTLAPGQPLDPCRPRDEVDVCRIVAAIADALAACHTAGVPHGDVKPANVMVDTDRVTLVDFGLSGLEGGTPIWAAPEVLDGQTGGTAADVYSLGLVAWALLHRALPHGQLALHEQLAARKQPIPAPTEGPDWLRELICTMLEPAPAARPSAARVADALDAQGYRVAAPTRGELHRRAATLQVPVPGVDEIVDRWIQEGGSVAIVGPPASGRSHVLRRAGHELTARGALAIAMVPGARPWGPIEAVLADPSLPGSPLPLPPGVDLLTRARDAASALLQRCPNGRPPCLLVDDLDEADDGTRATVRAFAAAGGAVLVAGRELPEWIDVPVALRPWPTAACEALVAGWLGNVDAVGLAAHARDAVGRWPGHIVEYVLAAVRAGAVRLRRRTWILDEPALERLDVRPDATSVPSPELPESARRLGATIALLQPIGRDEAFALAGADATDLEALATADLVKGSVQLTCPDLRAAARLRDAVEDLDALWAHIARWLREQDPVPWPSLGRAILGSGDVAAMRRDGPRVVRATLDVDVREAADLATALLTAAPTAELAGVHIDVCVQAGRLDEARAAGRAWLEGRPATSDDLPALLAMARLADLVSEDPESTRHWTRRAREVVGDDVPAEIALLDARAAFRAGELDQAEALCAPLCPLPADLDQPLWLSACGLLAQVRAERDGPQAGLSTLDAMPPGLGEGTRDRALAESVRGRLQWMAGRPRVAAATFEGVAAQRRALATVDRARNENNAALCWYTAGDVERAVLGFERALLAFEELGATLEIARVQVNLCQSFAELGRWARAMQSGVEAVEIAQRSGAPAFEAVALGNLGDVALWRRRYPEAARHYDAAARLVEVHGLEELRVELARRRAELAALEERTDALDLAEHARAIGELRGVTTEVARANALRALALARSGRATDAADAADAALGPLRTLGAAGELAVVKLRVAEAWAVLGDNDRVWRLCNDVIAYADEFGRRPLRTWAQDLLSRVRSPIPADHRRLELLTSLNVRVATQVALEDVLTELAAAAVELVDAQRAFVVLADDPDLRVAASAGDDLESTGPSMSVVRRVLELGRDVVIPDIEERADLRGASSVRAMKLRAVVCVPLFDAGTAVGALYLDSRGHSPSAISDAVALIRSLASHASVAVSHARLTAEVEHRITSAREIAHDVRNPLSGVLMLIDDVREGGTMDPHDATLAGDALRHALEMVSSTLTAETAPTTTFLWDDAVESWVRSLEPLARSAGVELRVQASVGGRVTGRPRELRRVLVNVVANALKYSPEGGRVNVVTVSEPGRLGLAVEDDGPGIPREVLERVFEAGVQGPRALPGHGLGLAIARRICREHGGDVLAEIRTPRGSRFTLWLPRALD